LQRAARLHPSPLGRIVTVCLNHLNWPRQENIEAVQVRARHEVVGMESGLSVLEVTTGVAPLLGLLGTLSGLVSVFANLGDGGTGDPIAVARGISEALNTTIVGLAVAAPSLVAHNYFQRKIETMAVGMEGLVADLLAKVYAQK
jgi:biopolymer transport protein ExbB